MRKIYFFLVLLSFTVSCSVRHNPGASSNDDLKLEAIFVQVNDVYEIAPLAGGKYGGMARVATIKKQYRAMNPNTFLVMSGDFVSPSVYNSLQFEGKRIRGRQMIEAMNVSGMDIVVFGNHEFDITESELQDRINESRFDWIASNTFHKQGKSITAFAKIKDSVSSPFPETSIMTLRDEDGTKVKLGFIGITLPFNKADYVSYTDPLATAERLYNQLKDDCDAVIAITHQLVEDDIQLAKRLPKLAVILGGHEHDMRIEKVGNVYITKAHANAKSAYIIKLIINKNDKTVTVIPELKELNETIPADTATDRVVQKWIDIADKNYTSLGFNARRVVLSSGEALDGRESEIRSRPTNLSRLVGEALAAASPRSDVVIFNTGSIRVDDILTPPITEYDILRTMPFGGGIREVDMKGNLLLRTLEAGRKNVGIGGFLLYHPVIYNSSTNTWTINNQPIEATTVYKVAMPEFLLSGREANLDFLNKSNPDMLKVYDAETKITDPRSDVRLALIRYLEKKK
ncbi:MAG: bifunctional metallophosphatase/5'-nucleotidase [Chitinophagaceae bacterium]